MRLLVFTEWFPYPAINGAKLRTYSMLRRLARFAEIDLVSLVHTLTPDQVEMGKAHLLSYCRSIDAYKAVPYIYSLQNALRTLVDPVPPVARFTESPEANQRVDELWAQNSYDLAFAVINGYPGAMARHLVAAGIHPLVLDSMELGVFRPPKNTRLVRYLRRQHTWRHMRRYVKEVLKGADLVTVSSQTEFALHEPLVTDSKKLVVVPNCLDMNDYQGDFGPRNRMSIVYAGSFGYVTNYDAVRWFAESIYSRLKHAESVRLRVTGNTAGRDLEPIRKSCPNVEFTGFVEDVHPYIAESRMSIVPIRAGGSTRLKIVESMALGTPVVSTRAGAEGLNVTHERDILLADTPEEFAREVDRLIEDEELWQHLQKHGRELVKREYSVDRMGEIIEGRLRQLLGT